jgi:hypothetical protein
MSLYFSLYSFTTFSLDLPEKSKYCCFVDFVLMGLFPSQWFSITENIGTGFYLCKHFYIKSFPQQELVSFCVASGKLILVIPLKMEAQPLIVIMTLQSGTQILCNIIVIRPRAKSTQPERKTEPLPLRNSRELTCFGTSPSDRTSDYNVRGWIKSYPDLSGANVTAKSLRLSVKAQFNLVDEIQDVDAAPRKRALALYRGESWIMRLLS